MPPTPPRLKRAQRAELENYADEFLECRNIGHQWRRVGFFESGGLVLRRLTCVRCDTDRTDRWGRDGARHQPRYDYADGYRLTGWNPAAQVVRVETIRRATVYTTEAAMLEAMGLAS